MLNDPHEGGADVQKNRLNFQFLKPAKLFAGLVLVMAMVPFATVVAQQEDRLADCTEKIIVDRVHIGHDCGEFASVLIAGNVVIQRPWSRVNRASRAERIRARREGQAPGTTAPVPPSPSSNSNCDPAYPDVCIPSPPPQLVCDQIEFTDFTVLPPDPQGFDGDNDGIGCESG